METRLFDPHIHNKLKAPIKWRLLYHDGDVLKDCFFLVGINENQLRYMVSDIGFIDTWTPVWRHERSYTYATNFSKVHGAHEIRFGSPRPVRLKALSL